MADQFLKDLLQTPGTSGAEQGVQNVVRAFASVFAAGTKPKQKGRSQYCF